MSFPRYPAYKPSGVEWLGEVPEHWEVLPLRRLIREVSSGTSVNAIDEPASPGQPGVLKTSCVYTGKFRPEENKAILESELERATCPVVAGSLIVSRMNTPDLVGATGLVKHDDPFLFLPDRLWQVTFQDCNPQFMNYWCKSASYRSQVQLACSGTSSSMQNLSQDNFYSFVTPLPPTGEQVAIATFLDSETAKIDALIAEQQRLIELLQEKRLAVISHAVTKGLNPDAPMKDSGVEWLGEVPEHWEVTRLKYMTTPASGIQMGPFGGMLVGLQDQETGFKLYGQENTISGDLTLGQRWLSREHFMSLSGYHVRDSDILLTRKGSLGNAMLARNLPHPGAIDSDTVRVRVLEELVDPSFLVLLLHQAEYIQEQFFRQKRGAILAGLNTGVIANLCILLPPSLEQASILQHIHACLDKFLAQLDNCEKSILLLQERRSALISAAVTGQIDVRGLVPEAEVG